MSHIDQNPLSRVREAPRLFDPYLVYPEFMKDPAPLAQPAVPSMIGCSSCAGALELRKEGHGHVQLRCSVGHTFSPSDAYKAKEEELERTQWSVIVLLKHLQMLIALMRDHDDLEHSMRASLAERETQIRHQIPIYERIVNETKPARQSDPPRAEPPAGE